MYSNPEPDFDLDEGEEEIEDDNNKISVDQDPGPSSSSIPAQQQQQQKCANSFMRDRKRSSMSIDCIGNTLISKVFVAETLEQAYHLASIQFTELSPSEFASLIANFDVDRLWALRSVVQQYTDVRQHLSAEYSSIVPALVLGVASALDSMEIIEESQKTRLLSIAEHFLGIFEAIITRETGGLHRQFGGGGTQVSVEEVAALNGALLQFLYTMHPPLMQLCFRIFAREISVLSEERLHLLAFLVDDSFMQMMAFVLQNSLNRALLDDTWKLIQAIVCENGERLIANGFPLIALLTGTILPALRQLLLLSMEEEAKEETEDQLKSEKQGNEEDNNTTISTLQLARVGRILLTALSLLSRGEKNQNHNGEDLLQMTRRITDVIRRRLNNNSKTKCAEKEGNSSGFLVNSPVQENNERRKRRNNDKESDGDSMSDNNKDQEPEEEDSDSTVESLLEILHRLQIHCFNTATVVQSLSIMPSTSNPFPPPADENGMS